MCVYLLTALAPFCLQIGTDESVHPVRHWKDIKNRLGKNMRCFVLMNRGIPREPLVVLHSALTEEPSSSVQVGEDNPVIT